MRHCYAFPLIAAITIGLLTIPVSGADKPFEILAADTQGPIVQPWKTLQPDPAYHGQWLAAGDLDGDGQAEIVTARHDNQSVTTVLASKLDGSVLWHWGKANTGKTGIFCDIPVQIYDLDGDGKNEVWLSSRRSLIVLNGKTGQELRTLPLPEGLEAADCITFANLRGLPRARDIIVKDRYHHLWAYTDDWKPLWDWVPAKFMTCHHPTLIDLDSDGRDEVLGGYTLLDDTGKELWTIRPDKANLAAGHLDCCEVMETGKKPADFRLLVTYCGANCLAMIDGEGRTIWERTERHFESVDTGKIRADVPGKQIVVDIAHGKYDGRMPVWLLDDQAKLLGSIGCLEPRHHRLIDWDGDGLDEILIGNTCRLINGRGECLARLGPVDAFGTEATEQKGNDPAPFASVGDLDGDGRPEIILHSATKILLYRNEKAAKMLNPRIGTEVNFTYY